ncbi:TPA: phage antirepressor N-terminal domain-containing protein [Raoultella ornithinolytica]
MSIAAKISTINVPFHGAELYVINHNGEPYTPMKPIIDGMGMDWASQFTKLKQRFKSTVVEITMVAADGKSRSMTCLALRKLNGWLQTISPNKVKPEIRDRVIQYQEECDDVLYQYWTKGKAENPRKTQQSTAKQLTPLRQTAERLIATGMGRIYPDIWKFVHQHFEIEHINQLKPSQISEAVTYLDALEGEFLGKQEALPAPKFDVNIPLQWWIDNNPVVRSGNLSFGKSLTAPAFDVTMDMLCGDNSTSAAIRLINVLEDAGFDVSAPKAEIVAMRKHLGNVEYGMKAIADACRRAGNKTISFRGGKAEYVIG